VVGPLGQEDQKGKGKEDPGKVERRGRRKKDRPLPLCNL